MLLEPHTSEAVEAIGREPASWSAQAGGLFSDQPHLLLSEAFWDAARQTATNRYYLLDAGSADVTCYAQSLQRYTEASYRDLIEHCGSVGVNQYASLTGDAEVTHAGLYVLMATRPMPP